jgi:hypothetical protein
MRDRLKTLRHLLEVYETMEGLREAEAQRAAGDVREAEQAIVRQKTLARNAAGDERQALRQGDRLGWSSAASRQQVAGARRAGLERVLDEREERSTVARRRHVSSRLWSERVRTLVQDTKAVIAEQDARHEQAAADERHLALGRWKRRMRDRAAEAG